MNGSEGPLLVDTGKGLTIRYNGRNLYSPSSPIEAARKRSAALPLAPQTLVFVPSPLLFYGIQDLLSRADGDIHLLCVETDQQLMRLSLDNTPASILHHPAISYIRTDSVDGVLRALHSAGVSRFRRAAELLLNAGSSINRPLYSKMFRAVEHEIQSYWRNRMTLMHMSHLWIKNFFLNLHAVAGGDDISHLRTDLPVVVAGAGESLEEAAPLLRSTRESYFLLAVDTAVGSVVDLGLRPDAVAVLDAQSANLTDLVGFDPHGVGLVADVSAYPECVRMFSGKRSFFFSEFSSVGLFDRARAAGLLPAGVPPLGSVGVAALFCALEITEGPVLFTGLDFAYRPGKSHARGAPTHIADLLRSGRLSPVGDVGAALGRPHRIVEGKAGERLWTDNSLFGYSSSLDIFVEGRSRVYDIGRTGLRNAARHIADRAAAERLLSGRSSAAAPPPVPLPSKQAAAGTKPKDRRTAAVKFLDGERTLVARGVASAMKAIRARAAADAVPAELRRFVRELDYVYLHFPDWSEEPELTEGFLKRFVEAAETRAKWIDRGLSMFT